VRKVLDCRDRLSFWYQFGLQQTRPTTIRCHLVVEHHGSLTVPSSLTASALLQGHPSQQSRRKGREKRRRPHPSLLPAAPPCASSTNFSTVSAPRPHLTNSLKAKLEKPRRRRVPWPPPIARDVSARVRPPLSCTAFLPCLVQVFSASFSFPQSQLELYI
jgi:hypothetical protein